MDIFVKRIVNVPVEILWEIWTQPEHIQKWWGPQDFTSPSAELDLKIGGRILLSMLSPEYLGSSLRYTVGEFKEIKALERLVFTQSLSDADGNVLDPADLGMKDFPMITTVIVEFTKLAENFTELRITQQGFPPSQMIAFAYAGWQQSVDKIQNIII